MPDNHSASEPLFFTLPDHAVVALRGPDAAIFAQAQFANDVQALAPGHWQWNMWLTPKGRVITLFALIKLREDEIRIVLADCDADALASQLQRFVFRRKLTISVPSDWHAAGAFAAPASAANARIGLSGKAIELDYGDGKQPRTLRLATSPRHADDTVAISRWRACDLLHGLPRLPASQREQWTPQQLSLERLQAFSVKKGCYPGQEIVARTHFLGKAKRTLALFESDLAVAPGSEISDGERVIGSAVSASDGERHLALAVLPLDREQARLTANGAALRDIPLSDGLQR